jgi:molybdate transport system substrate-binding protein
VAARAARFLFAALAVLLALGARADTFTVFAASSLQGPLDALARSFEAGSPHRVRTAYGASSALARQIEAGAPAQLFLSADREWMDHVAARGLLRAPARPLLSNSLVVVAPRSAPLRLEISPGFALSTALGRGRLAMADPRHVPAGKYARAALRSLGVWASVESRIAPAENVRAALALVARGEAPLGIVYATDARAEPGVLVAGTFPPESHPPIEYPLGILKAATPAAEEFARYLAGEAARSTWSRHGFGLPY